LQDAVDLFGAKPPFAAALNLNFIPKTQYAQTPLKSTDEIELISPITGG
jgi:sulfur carrier protein